MKHVAVFFLCLFLSISALAQQGTVVGPNSPCSAFGTASGTCLQGASGIGTPSSGVATNLTGTASGLTAGNVTTNANLTGPIASSGNTTSVTSQTGTGTTFAMSASPNFTGQVKMGNGASSAAASLFINNLNATSTQLQIRQDAIESWTIGMDASTSLLDFKASGTSKMSVSGTGNFTAAGTMSATLTNVATTSAVCFNTGTGLLTYDGTIGTCTISDERLKNISGPITGALEKLLKINGFYYTWKEPRKFGKGQQIGVGAQAVEAVFPELVQTDSSGRKSADYQRLTAPIIEALRELKAVNDSLTARLEKLENRN